MDTLSMEMQTPQRNNNNDQPSFRVQSSSFSSTTLNPSAPEFQFSGVRSGSSAYRPSLFATPAGMGMGMGGSYPLGTAAGLMDTTPHVIISGGGGLPPPVACRSPAAAAVAGVAAGGGGNLRIVSPSPPPNYDRMEEEIRRDLIPRCLQSNEHMVGVFNLDPKTTQKELTDIFFPCGATDSIILENTSTTMASNSGKGAGRKAGVVFFKGKDFALRAVKTFDNFAPQRQTQLIVVRYCGPDPAPEKRPPASSTTTATPTLSDSDVNVLVDLLNKNILESPDRTYVSLHAPEQHILDGILSSIREKMVGSVEYASWPLSSSHLHQYCAAVLKGPVRTAVISFPHRHIAIPFAREVGQRAVATKTPLRAVVLSGNGKHRGPSSSAAAAAPGLLGVGTGVGFPSPADQSLGGGLHFTGGMTDAAALHALSGAGLAEMALGATSNGGFPAVLGGWSVGGSDSSAAAVHTSGPSATTTTTIVEMLSAIHRQLHANTRFPLGVMLQRLLQHPHFTKNDVKKVVDSIAHAMQDPPLVELLKVLIVEAIDQLHSLEVLPMQADRRHALLSTVGREMLNLVVSTSTTVAEMSRDAAGHVAVFCFYFHYLPQTPCSFARCALEKLEPRLHRGERSPDKLDPCLFLTILGVLGHMVEMWKTLSAGVDVDALSFSDMKRRILETCSSLIGDVDAEGAASAGGRSALQLTPSARPTPRPLVTKSSPSSSSRRDPFRSNNGAHLGGAAPQVKLSMMDSTINGISTDVSVSVENSLLGGRSDGRRDEQRNECTVFVSPLPGKLTRAQIRRLLVHFGEISKVRLKPKVKHGSGKNDSSKSLLSGSSSVFVEFSTKKDAKRMIDFFSSPDKSFNFLLLEQDETWASEALFTEETVQLLYATAACQARNEIRESHPSDAVYSFASPSSDAGPGSRMLLSACTFGLEDAEGSSMMDTTTSTTITTKMSAHQTTTNNNNNNNNHPMMMAMHQNDATGISFSDISVEPIPSGNPFYHSFLHSDEDDMDDILHGACKNDDDDPLHHHHHGGDDGDGGLEDDDEMVLNFDHRMITAPSQHRQDTDEQAQGFNPSLLLFDGTSPVSSIYNEEDRDDRDDRDN